jgi:His-Xaa-Ser system radical SAM maturase HxsC
MTPLHGHFTSHSCDFDVSGLWEVVDGPDLVSRGSGGLALRVKNSRDLLPGFDLYISDVMLPDVRNLIVLPESLQYISRMDFVSVDARRSSLRVVWRSSSPHNSILLTERCDNYCLMCSQPPKRVDDSWLYDEAIDLISRLPERAKVIGFSGGEPTIDRQRFLRVLETCKGSIPDASIHVLSNGRAFSDFTFASAVASIQLPDLMIGIPIYADNPEQHDYVVQARGAFDQTVAGVLSLGSLDVPVEIRIVLQKTSADGLVTLARWIARNIPFVSQVAIMGLEVIGFARANLDQIWVDPVEYAETLKEAVEILDAAGIRVLVYNAQLCVTPREIWTFCVKSISDWKNDYHPECSDCLVFGECGGFFSSTLQHRHSQFIKAIR